jgi:uncharacterized protein (DUF2249 family)
VEHVLDVRDLEPPEPLGRILDALDRMGAADWLRVRHRREPFPLYNLLRNQDFLWRGRWRGDEFELLIWRAGATAPASPGAGGC